MNTHPLKNSFVATALDLGSRAALRLALALLCFSGALFLDRLDLNLDPHREAVTAASQQKRGNTTGQADGTVARQHPAKAEGTDNCTGAIDDGRTEAVPPYHAEQQRHDDPGEPKHKLLHSATSANARPSIPQGGAA